MPPRQRTTLSQVAKEAGVSRTAAYGVLNASKPTTIGISPHTRLKITKAAHRLGYIPSHAARTLASGRSQCLGLLITDTNNRYDRHLATLFEKTISPHQYRLHVEAHEQSPERERERLKQLFSLGIDGLILSPCGAGLNKDVLDRFLTARIPVILMAEEIVNPHFHYVSHHEQHGKRLIMEHLASVGLMRAAYLGNARLPIHSAGREAHFRRALAERPGMDWAGSRAVADYAVCRETLSAWLAMPNPPRVVLCFNDHLAGVAAGCLLALGARIPGDMAVVGVDGLGDPFAPLTITTERLALEKQVRTCWELFDACRRGETEPPGQCRFIEPDLFVGASTVG